MDVRGCFLLVLVLIWEKTTSSPINEAQNCLIDDIPVAPDFTFSQLSGVWYGIARTTTRYGNGTWLSYVWNFVQGEDGTIFSVCTGHDSQASKCVDAVVGLMEPTHTPGVYRYIQNGLLKLVHISDRTALMYLCMEEIDGICPDDKLMVIFCSRDLSMTIEDRVILDEAMTHRCLRTFKLHNTPQGLCKIPHTKTSLVSSGVLDRETPARSVFTSRGGTLTLTCSVTPPGAATRVVWTRITDGGPLTLTLRTAIAVDDGRIMVLRPSLGNWNLRITDVQVEDEGVYICMNDNTKKVRYIVSVLESPTILESEESFTASIGDTVVLQCPSEGSPPPSTIWYKQDQLHSQKKRCGNAKLDLVFILETSTAFGATNIELAMDFIRFFLVPANVDSGNVRIGFLTYSADVKIHFHLSDYRDKRNIYKAMDDIAMGESAEFNTGTAVKMARSLMFTASTGDRSSVSNAIILVTQGGSQSKAVAEAAAAKTNGIHMYVIGRDTASLQDVRVLASRPTDENSFSLAQFAQLKTLRNTLFASHCPEPAEGGHSLKFTDITPDQSGDYECVADNGIIPPASKTFSLVVHFPPEISVRSSEVHERQGQPVTLNCHVKANPGPGEDQLEWRYRGEKIETDLRHFVLKNEESHGVLDFSLRIGSLEEEDFGVYTCVATNALDTAEATIRLSEIEISDECDLARTRVQENFNIWDYLGEWHRVKSLTYRYGNRTFVSETTRYFINRGGYLSIAYMGKHKNVDECSDPGVAVLEQESPGKYHAKENTEDVYQFVHTDYTNSVLYICSGLDENGHCPDKNIHIEIMTKNYPIPDDKMAELEQIVEDLCINIDDMQGTTYGECEFPPDYLDSIGYGTGGINQEYLCDVERTRVQADFDINQFVGEWQTLKTTTFRHGANTSVSEMLHYFLRADGQLVLAHRGFNSGIEDCVEPGSFDLQEVQPGKYTLQHEGNTGSIQVVHTDYNYAVTMSCSNMAENGLCPAEHVNVQIIAKQHPVPESVLAELEGFVTALCVNIDDMIDNVPNLCDIPLSYLESAGFLSPESCVVNEMDVQHKFDKNRFLGMWNIIKTQSNHFGGKVYLTAIQDYFLKPDGALATAYRGYIQGSSNCLRPGTVVFEKDAVGNYVFQTLTGQGKFKIIYTDYKYAVTYSCRQVGADGKCVEGLQHASILARDTIIDPDTMRMLERYVQRTCADPTTLASVVPELCTIPNEFLESVGYTGPDRCQVANIPIQTDFDLNQFLGKWKTLKTLTYYHGEDTYTSMTHKYFFNADDHLTLAFRGYNKNAHKCMDPEHVVLEERSPGYFVMSGGDTYQIVYTDYEYAIVYLCGELVTDGHCLKEKTQVSILSRHDTISEELLTQLTNKISALCVDVNDLVDVAPEVCLISASYMDTAGYTGPPEDECQVSFIPHQEDLDITTLSGEWYAVMSTHGSSLGSLPVGPFYYYFQDWHMIAVIRHFNATTGMCTPTEAWNQREAAGPGDYYNFAGSEPAVHRILYASPKYTVVYICRVEASDGNCAEGQGQVTIQARSKVIPAEDIFMLKKMVTRGCFDSNDLKENADVECPVRDIIKQAAMEDLISEDHVVVGCNNDFVPVQPNLDIHKFADTAWNTLWQSSSIWGNMSLVPSNRKQIVVTPVEDDDDQIFLISRSYKLLWGSCEPIEVLRLTELEQPGDYTISFGESSSVSGMFRIMYADDEYAVTYTCYDTSWTDCPHDSLLVEILSTHKEIPEDELWRLKNYANEVCVDVHAMANTDPDACTIPDSIVQAVHDGQITSDYALPVAGCNGSLIEVDPNFDISLFVGGWNAIYSSLPSEGSSLSIYYQEMEGGVVYGRKVYNESMGECTPASAGIMLERSMPGDYATVLPRFPVIMKVLHVEESVAVVYICLGLDEDGTCRRDKLRINYLSRTEDILEDDLERLEEFVGGTCAETEDIFKQSSERCIIPENIITALDDGEVTGDYFTIECSMDYIATLEVTLDQIAGSWQKTFNVQPFMGQTLGGLVTYITPYGDGSQGSYVRSISNNSQCLLTEALKLTMEEPGTFVTVYHGFSTIFKVLHLDDMEVVFFVCTGQEEDGTCKDGHAGLQISSRNNEISPEKLELLKNYSSKVCVKRERITEMRSMCPIPEEIKEAARSGEFTQDHIIVTCQIKYIPVQNNFDISRYVGEWHGISHTSYFEEEVWTSKITSFQMTKNKELVYLGRGYNQSVDGCLPTSMVYLTETETPGYFLTGLGHMKVIFTDYTNAVLYWCAHTAVDGTCTKNKLHVELLSRNRRVNHETRRELMTYMRLGCVQREEDVVDYQIDRCRIPHTITDAVVAGEIASTSGPIQIQCMDRFVFPQRNFDKQRFTGHWYSLAQTHNVYGNNSWDSVVSTFQILDDGTFLMSFAGYDKKAESCVGPLSSELTLRGPPGQYSFTEEQEDVAMKIVYTDYEVAVVASSYPIQSSGQTYKDRRLVEILSRTKELDEETYRRLYFHTVNLCVEIKDMVPASNFDRCDFQEVKEDSIERKICSFNDIVPTTDFTFLQMAGLWYEVARTRFTYNKMESSAVFYKYLTESNMLEGLYTGRLQGSCQNPMSSLTKRHDVEGEPESHLLGRLGGQDSTYPWVSFKLIHFDGRYLMYYACYNDHDGGTCPRDKTEVTLFGRVKGLDHDIRSKIPSLMQSVCLKPSDLVESTGADCTNTMFQITHQTKPEPVLDVKCSPLVDIPVEYAVIDRELVGRWSVAADVGFGSSSSVHVTIRRHTDVAFKMEVQDGNSNFSSVMKPRCKDTSQGDYISSLGSTMMGQWSSLKIVYSDEETALLYWCLREEEDGTCRQSGIRVFLLARRLPLEEQRKQSLLQEINDVCVSVPSDELPIVQGSIPGSVIGLSGPPLQISNDAFNTPKVFTSFCAVDNLPTVNFHQDQQAGLWYEIARTPDPMLTLEATVVYYLPIGNGRMKMLYSGMTSDGQCKGPMNGELRPRCPTNIDGHYEGRIVMPRKYLWTSWKVLYTDYRQAMLAMSCMDENENGTCSLSGTKIHIMSRTHGLHTDVREKLNLLISSACMNPSRLMETIHDGTCLGNVQAAVQKLKTEYNLPSEGVETGA